MHDTVSEDPEDRTKIWTFPRSIEIPVYVYSLHAGEYRVWEKEEPSEVPVRIFARQEIAEAMEADLQLWFEAHEKGRKLFEETFNIPYLYDKIDAVIAPEFFFGAMENVAAITYSEDIFVTGGSEGKKKAPRFFIPMVIFHEVVHHWFGNSVTLEWWDDFWLNETFAEYFAFWALDALGSDLGLDVDAWAAWSGRKFQAFDHEYGKSKRADGEPATNHAIMIEGFERTDQLFEVVDRISYSKGAAALRQLNALVGSEPFFDSIRNYAHEFRGKNVNRGDFKRSFGESLIPSGFDFGRWVHQWFETEGLNTITAEYECADDQLVEFALVQGVAVGEERMRTHLVEVALTDESKTRPTITMTWLESFRIDSERTEWEDVADQRIGCPEFVNPNHGHLAYLEVHLDPRSLAYVKEHGDEIKDPGIKRAFADTNALSQESEK